MQPPGLHKARNAEQLLAYNADAFAAAAPNDIGALGDCECTHCGAQLWPAEATKVPPSARGYFGTDWRGKSCCGCGAIHVPAVERSPGVEALWADYVDAKLLRKHSRPLNNSLSLASSSISQQRNLPGGSSWSPTVSVQGKIYHNIGALNPAEGADRRWALHRVVGSGGRRLLECEIASGSKAHIGDIVYLPRLTLDSDDDAFPFKWSRRQFPVRRARALPVALLSAASSLAASQVRPAFAMTINKAQGQTLKRVGLYLPDSCFTHGQLYVAASRVGLPAHLRFAVPWDEETGSFRTRNIVFRDALTS